MISRMSYYRAWLAVPLVVPLLYIAGRALGLSPAEREAELPGAAVFLVFGWLPYACTSVGYYLQSRALTPDRMREVLLYSPLRMLAWLAVIVAVSCIASPFFLFAFPVAAFAALVVGYGVVGLALVLEAVLHGCGVLAADR